MSMPLLKRYPVGEETTLQCKWLERCTFGWGIYKVLELI